MLNQHILAAIYVYAYFIIFSNSWFFFFKNNFLIVRVKAKNTDKFNSTKFLKKLSYKLTLKYFYVFNFFFIAYIFTLKGHEQYVLFNHFIITNSNLLVVTFLLTLNFLCILILKAASKAPIFLTSEYVFSLMNLNYVFPLLFFVNNLYTLFFILEVISCLIFYKFSVSKFWLTKNSNFQLKINTAKFNNETPKYFLNSLFFQYWSSFFSSVLILISAINLIGKYGTLEWFFLNFFKVVAMEPITDWVLFLVTSLALVFGVGVKLGLTPIHLYKIEVYKGLPFMTLFFYTTYYFCVYMIFFSFFFFNYLVNYSGFIIIFVTLSLLSGICYVTNFFLSETSTKAFFGYSTVLNVMNCLFLVYFGY